VVEATFAAFGIDHAETFAPIGWCGASMWGSMRRKGQACELKT
jgi:hypothetical protein